MIGWALWITRQRKWEIEKWVKGSWEANLAFGEDDLMGGVREEGGGRGQPYQPHVQQARPPGELLHVGICQLHLSPE